MSEPEIPKGCRSCSAQTRCLPAGRACGARAHAVTRGRVGDRRQKGTPSAFYGAHVRAEIDRQAKQERRRTILAALSHCETDTDQTTAGDVLQGFR